LRKDTRTKTIKTRFIPCTDRVQHLKKKPCMRKRKKQQNPDKGEKLLEETKRRIRLEQEARTTRERIEQLDYESCEKLGKKLY
jgi:hypothetical protein